jgi:hypothetical protein
VPDPGDRKTIEIYLNDHFAGATTAIELLDDMIEREQDAERSRFLHQLRGELQEDFALLEQVAAHLGAEHQRVKQALADVGETLSRLKLARGDVPDELSLLLDLETLSVGIWGRTRLWRALAAVRDAGMDLPELDIEELEARGHRQLEQVEEHRLPLAQAALAG